MGPAEEDIGRESGSIFDPGSQAHSRYVALSALDSIEDADKPDVLRHGWTDIFHYLLVGAFSAAVTGVVGNAAYDGIKATLHKAGKWRDRIQTPLGADASVTEFWLEDFTILLVQARCFELGWDVPAAGRMRCYGPSRMSSYVYENSRQYNHGPIPGVLMVEVATRDPFDLMARVVFTEKISRETSKVTIFRPADIRAEK